MSRNKEATIILLDVGENTLISSGKSGSSFFERAKGCVSKIIQKKIFAKPLDEIAVLLMGTDETFNDINTSMGGFDNIVEMIPLQIPNWEMVRQVNALKICENSSDWIDGLVVALNFARNETSAKKFANTRIIVITNFITEVNDSNIDVVTETFLQEQIELLAISDCVEHTDAKKEGHFSQNPLNSQIQTSSQLLFKKVVEKCGGYLCHVDLAESQLLTFQKKMARSMPWNVTLTIGSQLKINVSTYVSVQEEKFLSSFKMECINPNTITKMVTEYEQNNQVIDKPSVDDIIKAYMYGSSIVPLNVEDDYYTETNKCLSCVGFTNKELVLNEYLAGEGSHTVFPQKKHPKSAVLFTALAQAMEKAGVVMIARKVYRNGLKPIAVILQPEFENEIASLKMIQLAFFNDMTLFSFPSLRTKKSEPTKEQEKVLKELVDAMDLMTALDDETGLTEAFSTETSLNPVNQHLCRSVAFRALHPSDPLPPIDPELMKMIDIPQKIQQARKEALKAAEENFPLELVEQKIKKVFGQNKTDSLPDNDPMDGDTEVEDEKNIIAIGTVSPAEDFGYLLKKGLRFGTLADQMQTVIYDLIFRTGTIQQEKILECIMMYREQAKIYSPFSYNNWIKELKNVIIQRNKLDFWQDFIVKEGFGLITDQEAPISTVTTKEQLEFYEVLSKDTRTVVPTDDNDDDLDALLG